MSTVTDTSEPDSAAERDSSRLKRCQNCGAVLDGPYCSECGQQHLDQLRFSFLWRKVLGLLFEADRGLPHTLIQAARNPGHLARRYVEGERKSFVGPVAYFLLTTTVMYLVYFVFKAEYVQFMIDMQTAMWAEMGIDPEVLFGPGKPFSVLGIESMEEYSSFVFELQQYLQTYVGLFVVVPAALLQYSLIGGGRSILEAAVFELYTLAQGNLITTILAPLCFWTYTPALMAVSLLVQVGIHAYAAGAFFGRTLRARILAPLTYVAGMLAFILLSVLLGILIGVGFAVYLEGV